MRARFAVSVTVNVFATPDINVLCWIDLVLKTGTRTSKGFVPLATPYSGVPGFVIALDAMEADPEAAMFTVGDVVVAAGFVILNPNVYVVPAARLPPLFTVKVSVPELHAPLPCVTPSENDISPSSPASRSVTGFVATAPVSPEIVTEELATAVNSVSVTTVTVILLDAPAIGLLWPIALLVKDCASATSKLHAITRHINMLADLMYLNLRVVLLHPLVLKSAPSYTQHIQLRIINNCKTNMTILELSIAIF